MPHRRDVEPGVKLELLRKVRQMHREHDDVWQALGAFRLKMMLGHPERTITKAIHRLRLSLRLGVGGNQLVVAVTP